MYIHIPIWRYVCTDAYVYIRLSVLSMYKCMYTYVCMYACMHVCMYVHTCVGTCLCVHMMASDM